MATLPFDVLAEPNRRRILELLGAGERPVGELVEKLDVSQPAVSKHLRVLREAGLVDVRTDAQRRLYRVRAEPLRAVDEWLEPYRFLWESHLDDLERHLDAMPEQSRKPEGDDMDGQLEQINDRWQLRFTRRLPHPPEKVWRALTEPEHLEAWFPTRIEGDRRAGAPLRFEHRDAAAPPMDGRMIAYEPPSLLELKWGDEDTLRFELQPDGDGTVLTLVNTFDEVGKAARDAAGWHTCLDRLAYRLEGEEPPWDPTERWQGVHPRYVESLGPEAAAIGPPEGFAD